MQRNPSISTPSIWTVSIWTVSIRTVALAGFAILLAAVISAGAGAQEEATGPAPRAVIAEPLADLGAVDRGETVTHEFVIRNEGDAPLQILEVRPTCGCTVAEFDEVIPPGESGKVRASLDTTSIHGASAKAITVLTNDPANPQLQLTLRVRVTEYLTFNPGFARFVQGRGHPAGRVTNLFFSTNFPNLEIQKVESPFPFLSVDVRPAEEAERREEVEGKQWIFDLTLDYDQAPVGPINGQIEVRTNHPKQPVGQLPVSGFIRPLLAVTPPAADFGEVDLSAPALARFLVHNFGAEPIQVTGIDYDLPGAEGSVKTVEEGRRYSVELVLDPDMPKGPFSSELKIRTDSPQEPVIVVPVKGTAK